MAAAVPVDKEHVVDVLYQEFIYVTDERRCTTETFRLVYRINNDEGVKYWSDVGGRWEPWYQSRPEVEARVITPDGVVHRLDPKTLADSPASEGLAATYSDDRGTTVHFQRWPSARLCRKKSRSAA